MIQNMIKLNIVQEIIIIKLKNVLLFMKKIINIEIRKIKRIKLFIKIKDLSEQNLLIIVKVIVKYINNNNNKFNKIVIFKQIIHKYSK